MKKIIIPIILLIIIIVIALLYVPSPPEAEEISDFISNHQEDIRTVNDYLLQSESKDTYISCDDGTILVDLCDSAIEDEAVIKSIASLWNGGCISIAKDSHSNSISYTVWQRTKDEANCGFVYAIDGTLPPEVQFQTELTPLQDSGWYYYLAEYNKWRASR